jgi:hypothetical protein
MKLLEVVATIERLSALTWAGIRLALWLFG